MWPENKLRYLSLDIISSTKLTVFLEPSTVGIFSRQMEVNVYMFPLVEASRRHMEFKYAALIKKNQSNDRI